MTYICCIWCECFQNVRVQAHTHEVTVCRYPSKSSDSRICICIAWCWSKKNYPWVLISTSDILPLEVQELLTLPEHPGSPSVFSRVRVSLIFCVVFCRSLIVLFLLTILLFVVSSVYPYDIFRLVLTFCYTR